LIVEPLQKEKHDRLGFSCGNEALDRFLREHAHQAAAKNLSKTYVAVAENDETAILGFYTVTTCRIEAGELPPDVARLLKVPDRDLPASLVARLAVSESVKGQGVGSLLLLDALARCARVAGELGGIAIVVDAVREDVVPFYERVGFRRLDRASLKMFVTMATVRTLLGTTVEVV
jgi:GNAT superfamily N-acetyltransferase